MGQCESQAAIIINFNISWLNIKEVYLLLMQQPEASIPIIKVAFLFLDVQGLGLWRLCQDPQGVDLLVSQKGEDVEKSTQEVCGSGLKRQISHLLALGRTRSHGNTQLQGSLGNGVQLCVQEGKKGFSGQITISVTDQLEAETLSADQHLRKLDIISLRCLKNEILSENDQGNTVLHTPFWKIRNILMNPSVKIQSIY